MITSQTRMRNEIGQIPDAVDDLLRKGAADISHAAAELRDRDPAVVVSVARGSSDHAAAYFKYLCELMLGRPVASVGPSVASVYDRKLRLESAACLAISQSGASPDIVAMARMAREAGALSLALTNEPGSDLADVSDLTLSLNAGAETSVAATKTFVTSAVSAAWLVAEWAEDADLISAIHALPDQLRSAVALDWSALREAIGGRDSVFCLGRGPGLAMANEAALKFKETCRLHAESYSSAEVMHGPVSIVGAEFPVVALASADAAEVGLAAATDDIARKGARAFATSHKVGIAEALPFVRTDHPLLDPVTNIASFYTMVETVAVARGIDPDSPRHLRKITETV